MKVGDLIRAYDGSLGILVSQPKGYTITWNVLWLDDWVTSQTVAIHFEVIS